MSAWIDELDAHLGDLGYRLALDQATSEQAREITRYHERMRVPPDVIAHILVRRRHEFGAVVQRLDDCEATA